MIEQIHLPKEGWMTKKKVDISSEDTNWGNIISIHPDLPGVILYQIHKYDTDEISNITEDCVVIDKELHESLKDIPTIELI